MLGHAIDVAAPYIKLHPVKMYVDGTKFRTSISDLLNGTRNEVLSKINEALSLFSTRSQNASIDYNETITTTAEASDFSTYIKDYSDKLTAAAQVVLDNVDSLIESHTLDRPLLRATGNRKMVPSTLNFDGITTFSYEFKNVGNKIWSGWMTLKLTDQYKKSVSVDFAPSNIPVVDPGETVWLSREITVEKTQYVNGSPRTWGSTTKIQVGIYTRNA